MKLTQKIEAIKLRQQGKSYKEIRERILVSKGTLSLWLRDIELTEIQKHRLFVTLKQQNAFKLAREKRKIKKELQKTIIEESAGEVTNLLKDPIFAPGLMLYWAEGDKSDMTEIVKFTNSDSIMIKFMMEWFRKICKISENKFRIALHIHTLHCRKDIEKYWSRITNIPLAQFQKTQIKPTTLKHRKKPLYDGTCAIVICNKNLFRKIKGWKLGFLQSVNMIDKNNPL